MFSEDKNHNTLDLSKFDFNIDYNSEFGSNLLEQFYIPCLNNSIKYDRAAAYFRTSIYHLIGPALSDFALRKGKMRLICSPSLDNKDLEILKNHYSSENDISNLIENEIEKIKSEPTNIPVLKLFGSLLKYKILDVKIAYRPKTAGIFHMKMGVFIDPLNNILTFKGSDNETFMAWHDDLNYESFEVFTSWQAEKRELKRIESHKDNFEKLWANKCDNLVVVDLPNVPEKILTDYANKTDISNAIEEFRDQYNRKTWVKVKSGKTPQEHQIEIINNWWNEKRGLVDHVTGAGKTFTSLCIIREWFSKSTNKVIVVVPSNLLANQWEQELRIELMEVAPKILRIGGDNVIANAFNQIALFTHPQNPEPTVIIATMQSACKEKFISKVSQGDHLLLIADEVHKIGSREHRNILKINAGGKLGLSATPNRYFDEVGTNAIFEYFGEILNPRFSIKDAQRAGRLVEYDYYIDTVSLDEDERDEYNRLTKRIIIEKNKNNKQEQSSDIDRLLQRRAQILKNASSKIDVALKIIEREYEYSKRQCWLVYCDNKAQLENLSGALEKISIPSTTYTSDMIASKKETIEYFEQYGGLLLSIHCLDEGVDIPKITHALILASSINPREHLQRRGRVLRKTKDKYSANIYDVLVGVYDDNDSFKVFKSELDRSLTIAKDARNDFVEFEIQQLIDRSYEDENISFEQNVE